MNQISVSPELFIAELKAQRNAAQDECAMLAGALTQSRSECEALKAELEKLKEANAAD